MIEKPDFAITEKDRNDIVTRTYKFALRAIYVAGRLPQNALTFRIINQLVGSGTSIGSNTEEALAGFSKNDFTYKMSIASKEAREVNYWLRLLRDSQIVRDRSLITEISDAIDESGQMKRILTSIVKTSQEKARQKDRKRL